MNPTKEQFEACAKFMGVEGLVVGTASNGVIIRALIRRPDGGNPLWTAWSLKKSKIFIFVC